MYREGGFQQTIKRPVEYTGIGLHSGKEVMISCLPADADTGIVFRRIDLPSKPEITAKPGSVVSTKRCTSLGWEEKQTPAVHTVEHLLAAFWLQKIDNIIVEINGAETPVGDGSAYPYIEILKEGECKELPVQRRVFVIEEPCWVRRGRMCVVALPYDGFKVSYTLDYKNPVIGTQFLEFDRGEDSFTEEIARARTFGFKREVEALQKKGLALGGSLDNAVLVDRNFTVNELRYPDEFVRHKILDVVGDMALNGFIEGHIIGVCAGHSLHVELARRLHERMKAGEEKYSGY